MYRKVLNKFYSKTLKIRTFLNSKLMKSDFQRWSNIESLSLNWEGRTKMMSEMIEPNSVVLEFGAGRMGLKKYLPKDSVYIPSDLVSRSEEMIACDLNDKNFPFIDHYDVVFLSGVFEYIHDVPNLIAKLKNITNEIICSYATIELNDVDRLNQGWVNGYNEDAFCNLFLNSGFSVEKKDYWHNQVIFKFIK